MPQEAMIAVAYTDGEGLHAGFVTIRLPEEGDPANAGAKLLALGAGEAAASTLRREGFWRQPREVKPSWSYKQVMRHARDMGIPHIYRLQNGGWEYQHAPSMYRSLTLDPDTLPHYADGHRLRMMGTRSPHQDLLPPEMREETAAGT